MTSILSGSMSTKRRMSRFELSETVSTRVARLAASRIDVRAYASATRFGRYCGNIRWMQSWIVTTERQCTSGGST
ncbi:MAG: hypothetical protein AUI11_03290 [Acidobacteria bacterium 13_2_20CM_2_66_4]|nr:MAG: hypothetical protein AUI11_03290 [Acidobacteria bacterium 13_2_20CM_2_66_4]